jgi:hypothetical protein
MPASRNGLRRISLIRTNRGKNRAIVLTRTSKPPVIFVDHDTGHGGLFADSGWKPLSGPWVVAPADFNGLVRFRSDLA